MSAFLCDDITINRVASYVDTYWLAPHCKPVRDLCFINTKRFPNLLAGAMRLLNEHALTERYGSDIEQMDDDWPSFKFQTVVPTPRIEEAQYALRCWLYQCSEGDTTDKPLFKALSAMADVMGSAPEYNEDYAKGLTNSEYWR